MKYRYDNQDHNKDARASNTPQQDPQPPKRIKNLLQSHQEHLVNLI